MANNLGNAVEKFTKRLDQVIETGTVTADLNINGELLGEMSGNGKINIARIDMDGLADHARGGGFVRGGIKLEWDTYQLEFERDREFSIDVLDDEERELLVSANAMNEFARTKVVPEVDAVRFARLAENAGTTASKTFSGSTAPADALEALMAAETCMEDNGRDLSGCILYCTSTFKQLLRKAQEYRMGQGEAPNGRFDTFDDMRIRVVPTARFYTGIALLDGKKSGEEAGGYKAAAGAKSLNFIVMHPDAAEAVAKHERLRYFSPDVNQDDEAHLWQYRLFHDLLVYKNRKQLIYAHTTA